MHLLLFFFKTLLKTDLICRAFVIVHHVNLNSARCKPQAFAIVKIPLLRPVKSMTELHVSSAIVSHMSQILVTKCAFVNVDVYANVLFLAINKLDDEEYLVTLLGQ